MTLVGTNLELFGTDVERKIKEASAGLEPVWSAIREGLNIWRVNKFKLETVNGDGVFYTGDSYLILNTLSNELSNIHFWLGKETSQDEAGTAAYKAMELDTFLHGKAVQYREIQGNESELFKSYFKTGLRYVNGGYDSGFNKIKIRHRNKVLYWVHDTKITPIPMTVNLLNEGDVFILDLDDQIQIFRGEEATHKEALLAEYEALDIKAARSSERHTKIVHIETPEQKQDFKRLVSQNVSEINSTKLFRISDSEIEEVEPITSNLMDNDAYVLKSNDSVWVWLGCNCSITESQQAWKLALQYSSSTDRVCIIRSGLEPESFFMRFKY